ncbi:probable serine/threonine-protein kinase drkD [Cynara cardunculus var. scolymus]|uniref:probable serine/threonine-protein kinase drkD n=1 Tax=Cynara cardunculus var. scolymus TaxID=59895 RepID=UPI000D62CA1E|nr:probable serine/threonine-protein kinase drkD [Cynara cardunculus var. scolymus]
MKSEVSGTSDQHLENVTRDEIELDSCIRNVSVQTGEEFSPHFLRNLSLRRKLQAGGESSQENQQDRITSGRTIQTGKDCPQEFHKDSGIPTKIVEECSLEHIRDHGASSRTLLGNVTDQYQQKRVGFQFNENELVYEYQNGTQISKKDPVNATEFLDFWGGRELQTEAEQTSYSGVTSRYHRKDYTIRGHQQNPQQSTYTNEIYNVQALHHKADQPHQYQPHQYQPYGRVSGVPDGSFSEKIKFLCSFGGRILARPSDGKLRYVGGDTRIISIKKNLSYQELMRKTYACCNQPHIIKYQLPGEDLDALISVCSDEDFHHMIDEYHGLEKGSQRLRIFLESSNELESPCSSEARSVQQTDNAYKYVVSVNGITEPSLRKTSSRESYAGSPTDSNTSFQRDSPSSIHLMDITGSSTNLTKKLPSPTQFIQTPGNMKTLFTRSPSFPYRDAMNSQLRVGRDRVDQPAYENSYHLDVTGYQVNQDNITLGTYQQLDRRFVESRPTCEDHSHVEGSNSENMYYVQRLYGQGNASFKKPVLNESAIQSEKFVISHKQNPKVVPDMQCRREVAVPSRQNVVPYSILSKLEESASFLQQQDMKTQTSKCENHPVISNSDASKQYPEWDMIKWMEKNNLNMAFDLDTEEYQHSVSPATPLERQHSIATTVSSDTVSNLSTGLQHNISLETSRADANAENPFLLTTSVESNHTLTSDSNENDHLFHDLVIPNSTIFAPISRDVSLGESSIDNLGERSLSQTSDEKNVDDSDSLPPDILLSTTEFLYIQEKTSGVLTASHKETERAAQSDSKDVELEDDKRIRNGSISDTTVAEIQAGIHGLQTIKNADLEELRELGCGTFGTVYHGKWRGTDVAIKRIREGCFSGKPSEQDRLTKDFWREAQILSQLHHPNVVALYGVVRDGPGGTLSTVTEYMANGSLRHVLSDKNRVLDRRKKLMIAQDAAIGMEYLHLKNIVHFDLKCDNLLVNLGDPERPVCKVGDFGLSRIKRNSLVSGGARGTLPWIAPELLAGSSSRVSEKVDVFSFGIAMWEILTGEEPYADMHCGAIIGGIVTNTLRPPIPKHCDHGWKALMEECWSNDPADRPSFTQIANRLQAMFVALQSKKQTRVQPQPLV